MAMWKGTHSLIERERERERERFLLAKAEQKHERGKERCAYSMHVD